MGMCNFHIRFFVKRPGDGNRRMKNKGVPMTKNSKKLRMWVWLLALPLLLLGSGVAFAQSQPAAASSIHVRFRQAAAPVDSSTLTRN